MLQEVDSIIIDALSSEGDGIGSLDSLRVFVPLAIPGDKIKVHSLEKKKNFAKAELDSIESPSEDRVTPVCPYFGSCGGCSIMSVAYDKQIKYKRDRVVSAFKKISKIDIEVEECRPSPNTIGYRNKLQFPINMHSRDVGLYKRNSHFIISIDKCAIQTDIGNEIVNKFRDAIPDNVSHVLVRNGVNTGEVLVVFVAASGQRHIFKELARDIMQTFSCVKGVIVNIKPFTSNTILSNSYVTIRGERFFHEKLLNKTFRVSPGDFFQVNTLQAENLFQELCNVLDVSKGSTVLDTFCGVGAISLLIADKVKSVIGIEISAESVEKAKYNASLNDIENCKFITGSVESLIADAPHFDAVIINPPRKGCEQSFIEEILARRPKQIIYISCNPESLARDISMFKDAYEFEKAIPFDMFPQTMHVETLLSMKLKVN